MTSRMARPLLGVCLAYAFAAAPSPYLLGCEEPIPFERRESPDTGPAPHDGGAGRDGGLRDTSPDSEMPTCTPSTTEPCTCSPGETGERRCNEHDRWDDCTCPPPTCRPTA